jgi:5-formyltetrahydrofolate cyclo-ligase
VSEEKRALRRVVRAARDARSPAQRAAASRAVAARLAALPELAAARRLVAYAATPREVDLDDWLRQRLADGTELYLPWVAADARDGPGVRLARVTDLAELAPGWRGLREPRHAAGEQGVDPAVADAAVVPGLAFDPQGMRLGQGGGHLDRLLAALRPGALVVGVAFDVQVVDGPLPEEPHDVRMDIVVTEHRVLRAA